MNPTLIEKNITLTTQIGFFHLSDDQHENALQALKKQAEHFVGTSGFVAINLLSSTDHSRICSYIQWQKNHNLPVFTSQFEHNIRTYEVFYTHDRSPEAISVITNDYQGVTFINEISTLPTKQHRLLELVIANNEKISLDFVGYRSANFHRSLDGECAVNYSLWDSEADLITAISSMADEDINLEETIQIASPDFRFYTLAFAAHS